jgi:hypothetical protein
MRSKSIVFPRQVIGKFKETKLIYIEGEKQGHQLEATFLMFLSRYELS